MSDHRTDEAKGRAKEAAGSLADDEDLKKEGKADRAASSVKKKAEEAKDKADETIDSLRDRVSGS